MPHAEGPAAELFALEAVTLRVGDRTILDAITTHVHQGHVTAVVGPSGAGKSTLLRMLNRFEEPTSGRVLFHGVPLVDLDVRQLRRRVGFVAQRATMLADRVDDEVRVGQPSLPDADVDRLLAQVALDELGRDRRPAELSGGEQQRLALARALAVGPEVLLLDEPTSSLDPRSSAAVAEVIAGLAAAGVSVVLVTHDRDQAAALTDDALVLDGGRLVERGDPATVAYLERSDP